MSEWLIEKFNSIKIDDETEKLRIEIRIKNIIIEELKEKIKELKYKLEIEITEKESILQEIEQGIGLDKMIS